VIGSVSVDTSPPSGTLLINDDAQFINTPEVALSLSGNDPLSGLAEMSFSKRRDKLVRLGAFRLPQGLDPDEWRWRKNRVRLGLRDFAGNVSLDLTDDIILDQIKTGTWDFLSI